MSFRNKNRIGIFLLSTLALLIKPPIVIAFALVLLDHKSKYIKHLCSWMIPSFLVTILYYFTVGKYIDQQSDIAPYFYTQMRNPLEQLLQFFQSPKQVIELIFKDIFNIYLLIFILFNFFKNRFSNKKFITKLVLILILQIIMGAALDGHHSFIHHYYFIGTSFTVAIIFSHYLNSLSLRAFKAMTIILFLFILDKGIYANYKTFTKNILWQCQEIKTQIPEVHKIRTRLTPAADLGVCMKAVEKSKISQYGVYYKDEYNGDPNLIDYTTKDLVLIKFY